MDVRFQFTSDFAREIYGGQPPTYATQGSAGVDLRVVSFEVDEIAGEPLYWCHSGIIVEIPTGYFGLLVPRSSTRMRLVNTVGVIDSDYRGEIVFGLMELVPMHDISGHAMPTVIQPPLERIMIGQRLCQLVITPCLRADWSEADSLSRTDRGTGAFGSTGE